MHVAGWWSRVRSGLLLAEMAYCNGGNLGHHESFRWCVGGLREHGFAIMCHIFCTELCSSLSNIVVSELSIGVIYLLSWNRARYHARYGDLIDIYSLQNKYSTRWKPVITRLRIAPCTVMWYKLCCVVYYILYSSNVCAGELIVVASTSLCVTHPFTCHWKGPFTTAEMWLVCCGRHTTRTRSSLDSSVVYNLDPV